MSDLTFIIKKHSDDSAILALKSDLFEQVNFSDCYGADGQSIGDSEAGNYICLTEEQAAHMTHFWDVEENGEKEFKAGTVISAYDDYELFETVKEELGEDCVQGEIVTALSYHDGHNWKSIIIDSDEYGTHETVSDEIAQELTEIYESEDFQLEKDGPYCQTYKTEKFIFTEYNFQGHPELFEVKDSE